MWLERDAEGESLDSQSAYNINSLSIICVVILVALEKKHFPKTQNF